MMIFCAKSYWLITRVGRKLKITFERWWKDSGELWECKDSEPLCQEALGWFYSLNPSVAEFAAGGGGPMVAAGLTTRVHDRNLYG